MESGSKTTWFSRGAVSYCKCTFQWWWHLGKDKEKAMHPGSLQQGIILQLTSNDFEVCNIMVAYITCSQRLSRLVEKWTGSKSGRNTCWVSGRWNNLVYYYITRTTSSVFVRWSSSLILLRMDSSWLFLWGVPLPWPTTCVNLPCVPSF